jgi:predicted O-methyltransferase YrrM
MKESEVHPHVPEEKAELFSSFDGGSTEIEYLDFLTGLIRIVKPEMILETGTYRGFGTIALLRGVKANGFGKVVSIDIDQKQEPNKLKHPDIEYVEADSLKWLAETDYKFQFAFFDSELKMRLDEYRICSDRKVVEPGSVVVFHDTSKTRVLWNQDTNQAVPDPATKVFWSKMQDLIEVGYFKDAFQFPLSRGLTMMRSK